MSRKNAYILLLLLFLAVGGASCFVFFLEPELLSVTAFATSSPETATLTAPVRGSAESEERMEAALPTLPELPTVSSGETEESMETLEIVETVESEETIETENAPEATADAPQQQYTYTAIQRSKRLFIRTGPSLEADIISFLKPGDTGEVIEIGEEWVLLRHGDVEGYSFKKYLSLEEQ